MLTWATIMEAGSAVLPEAVMHEGTVELMKLGLAGLVIVGLLYFVKVLWQDNIKLRRQNEADQEVREKRDDARFQEVKVLAESAAKGLEKSSGAQMALASALENTNRIVDKQGDLIEARTAIFANIATGMTLNEVAIRALKDSIDSLARTMGR